MEWKRARSDEQKEARIRQIANAASKLFETVPYEQISMATIARELDFTRGNLYKYFSTKEEILLKVVERDLAVWVDDLEQEFSNVAPGMPGREFGKRWAVTMLRRVRLLKMLAILYPILERNASVDMLADFKTSFFASMRRAFRVIHHIYPHMTIDDVNELLRMQVAFAMGLYPMSVETEAQRNALDIANLTYNPPDFAEVYSMGVGMMIEGFERNANA